MATRPLRDLFDLTGTVALVTGGSKGVGRMIADGFLAQGAKVYIASRDLAAVRRAADELSSDGRFCIPLQADISTHAGVRKLADDLRSRESVLHVLVNNAGASSIAEFAKFSEDDWDRVMDLNLKTPFFLTQALLDLLCAAVSDERPAKVINISSVDGIGLNARGAYSYGASKAGLIQLTRQMAAALIGSKIVVSAIAPGAFASDMNLAARDKPALLAKRVPARRIGHADDMAGVAAFLASRAGDYVVGATITVDGGFAYALPTHGYPLE